MHPYVQEQQRQIMDQSKVVQRWKDPSNIHPTSTITSPPAVHTPSPHLSPTTTVSHSFGFKYIKYGTGIGLYSLLSLVAVVK